MKTRLAIAIGGAQVYVVGRAGVDNGDWSVRSPSSSCLPFLHRMDRHAVCSWLGSPVLTGQDVIEPITGLFLPG